MLTEVSINKSIAIPTVKKHVLKSSNNNSKKKFNNKKRILSFEDTQKIVSESLTKAGGHYVRFDDVNHSEGFMCGACVINNCIFFAIINKDRKVQYVHCDLHFSILRNPSNNLSVLDYLIKTNRRMIEDIVTTAFEDDENVELFTKNYIIREYKKRTNKRK